MTTRITLNDFLQHALPNYENLTMVAGDASFRQYYRAYQNGVSYIIMDAPPEHEDVGRFVQVSTAFAQAGVNVPDIIEDDLDNGYLLLSDFGDDQLQHFAMIDPTHWLPIALDALFDMQRCGGQHVLELPMYDESLLLRELSLFPNGLLPSCWVLN